MDALARKISEARKQVKQDEQMTWDEVDAWNKGFNDALEIFRSWASVELLELQFIEEA